MATTFIAVQCFQCSTMQVKQKKSSSNKWTCAVCNEKQSVRKVFFHALMAKNVRSFVQNFNMARMLSDQQNLDGEERFHDEESCEPKASKKRSNWSEYVDDEEVEHSRTFHVNEGDGGVKPVIVTEMPKAVLKKPKLRDYYSSHQKVSKQQFPNRNHRGGTGSGHCQDKQSPEDGELDEGDKSAKENHQCEVLKGSISRWSNNTKHETVSSSNVSTARGRVSKWSSFICQEDEDGDENLELREKDRKQRYGYVVKDMNLPLESNDELVEDDIHPDFL